jgi:hypothetical protein
MKNFDGAVVIFDKIDVITVISNLVCPPDQEILKTIDFMNNMSSPLMFGL